MSTPPDLSTSTDPPDSADQSTRSRRWHQQVKELVDEALDLPAEGRSVFLDQACPEGEMRREVEALLDRDERLGGFLERPFFALRASADESDTGHRLGPYRLARRIGSGGMGSVYLAEREDGELRQQVAIKVLKRGQGTEDLLRRFHMERQILADLAHPYITRLLDVGTTDDGRPFLVMEHVDGEPIDAYCDARGLAARQRVALFRQVCEAVQVAHQNLVVHRDLKPANILVTADGTPKLLDFGIAKLLGRDPRSPSVSASVPASSVPASSVITVPGTSPLTFSYASPEQVSGGPITTATDVYALGVVLYKLLTGRLPHAKTKRSPEQPPARPSAAVQSRAAARRLSGDLDAIVLKALRPESELRFSSAEQLSEDLHRHLEGLPVRSRPNTPLYRYGKFVRRHALGVSATVLIVLLVLGSSVEMAMSRQTIRHERDRTEEAMRFLEEILKSPYRGEALTVREALDAGVQQLRREQGGDLEIRADLLDTIGGVYRNLALYKQARPLLKEALDLRRRLYGEDHVLVAETLHNMASLEKKQGRVNEAELYMRQALQMQRRGFPRGHRDLARGLNNLAGLFVDRNELEEAEVLARESLTMKETLFGSEHTEVTEPLNTLATVLRKRGELEEAEALYRRCLNLRRRLEDPVSPELANVLSSLSGLLVERGAARAAIPLYQEALDIRRKLYVSDHPKLVLILNNFGRARIKLGEWEAAVALLEEGLTMAHRLEMDGRLEVARLANKLTWARLESGAFSGCHELAHSALEVFRRHEDLQRMAELRRLLGDCPTP